MFQRFIQVNRNIHLMLGKCTHLLVIPQQFRFTDLREKTDDFLYGITCTPTSSPAIFFLT